MKKRSLGHGFSDEIAKFKSKVGHFQKKETEWIDLLLPNFDSNFASDFTKSLWRLTLFYILCIILFFIIFLRIFHLQVVSGNKNRELADGNRIQVKVIHAQRGVIFDRNGKILAANSPAFRLVDNPPAGGTKKVKLISRDQALELEVKNDPRVNDLEIDNVRTYPQREKLAHVVGFVGEISETELKKQENGASFGSKNYQIGDRIGKAGIEAQYEKLLRGIDGGEIIEVDSQGREIRSLRKNPSIPGQNIYLTIDSDLQDKIFEQSKDMLSKVGSLSGAVIAMDPKNGQILSLLSFPSFDPNIFTNSEDEGLISQVFSNSSSPILNRAIGGTYPPGSTFKIVSALAALTSGKITPETEIFDNGVTYLGIYKFTNWYFNQYGRTEGPVNLEKAIKRSNDTYFYHVGEIVGEKFLGEWAKKLLLGSKLGIDLPGETVGLVPTDEWKRQTIGEVWFPGDTLHMAIGQGFVLATPLEILGITSYIANDGTLFKPQLLLKVEREKQVVQTFKPKIILSKATDPKWVKLIKQGLTEVPKEGGTAWPFFSFPIQTGGKTGTAEYGDPNRTHAWYTSFAPVDDPKIVMTVLIEGGGEGSSVSAPIVKEAYRWYFSEDKNKLLQDVYPSATDSGKTLGE